MVTPFRFFIIEMELTDAGILNFEKLFAFIFEYLSIVRDEWFAEPENIPLFKEMQAISNLSYQIYKIPDPKAHTIELS